MISIGFVVEPGQETNSVVVFNFQTKQKEERLVRETLVLPRINRLASISTPC